MYVGVKFKVDMSTKEELTLGLALGGGDYRGLHVGMIKRHKKKVFTPRHQRREYAIVLTGTSLLLGLCF